MRKFVIAAFVLAILVPIVAPQPPRKRYPKEWR